MLTNILGNMKAAWKRKTTLEKISLVIDILCTAGSGFVAADAGKKLSEGKNPVVRICIKAFTGGVGIYAGNVASNAMKTEYGVPIAAVIDRAREKRAKSDEENKEVTVDE